MKWKPEAPDVAKLREIAEEREIAQCCGCGCCCAGDSNPQHRDTKTVLDALPALLEAWERLELYECDHNIPFAEECAKCPTENARYEPKTTAQHLGYLIEECGEVLAAAGKSVRWGLSSVNPEIPATEQETNEEWLMREAEDLERAIFLLAKHLRGERGTVTR